MLFSRESESRSQQERNPTSAPDTNPISLTPVAYKHNKRAISNLTLPVQ